MDRMEDIRAFYRTHPDLLTRPEAECSDDDLVFGAYEVLVDRIRLTNDFAGEGSLG